MTPELFAEWRAYDELEPIGPEWLARGLCLLLQPWLNADTDATLPELLEGLGFRHVEQPIDGDAAEKESLAAFGAI